MRYANTSPYVPELLLWEGTGSAVEWAQYVSDRSRRGSTIKRADGSSADIVTRDEETRSVDPPDLGPQVDSPYRSYPMKKFYRGLLEEFQPAYYEALKQQGRFDVLPPIGHHDGEDGWAPVYEPAYPIGDDGRVFEYHEKGQDFGLRFLMVQSMATRSARLSRAIRAFKKEINYAEKLNAAANLYELSPESFSDFGELGYVSPLLLGGTQAFNEVMLGMRTTAGAFEEVTSKIAARVKSDEITLPDSVSRYAYDRQGGGIGPQAAGLKPLGDDPLALSIVTEAGFVNTGGLVNFGVPGGEYTQTYVPFGEEVRRVQEGIIRRYAQIIHRLNERAGAYRDGPVWKTDLDDEFALGWVFFLNEKQAELIEKRTEAKVGASEDYRAFLQEHSTPELRDAFAQYVLRFDFIREVGQFLKSWEAEVSIEDTPIRQAIKQLAEAAEEVSVAINKSIQGSRQSVEEYYKGQGGELSGFLDLSQSGVESVQLRFTNRFADMEAGGYPNPAPQHIGGGMQR
jgi:hypothetical protein